MKAITYHRGLKCFDSCLVYALEEIGVPYPAVFSKSIGFVWDERESLLGRRIQYDPDVEGLASGFGLWERGGTVGFDEIDLTAGFCLLRMDAFCCPWHRCFQTVHTDHYCLLTAHDEAGFVCIDPMMSSQPEPLPDDLAAAGYLDAWKPNVLVQPHEAVRNAAIHTAAGHLKQQRCILPSWMEAYHAGCLSADISLEFSGLETGSYEVPLYRSLWHLSSGHELFASFLLCMYGKRSDRAVRMLTDIGRRWEQYRKTAARDYLASRKTKKYAALSAPSRELFADEADCLDECCELIEGAPAI